ncbi:hypothetical protein MMC28_004187 [Mycoblastus sanguinarius]|nr:hypothetical protein [Mycoblastus sanguinarius]
MSAEPAGPGGFLQSTLPSPPPSSSHSSSTATSILPQPRSTPLKPGSAKESSFIDYVDRKLLGISRRYEKRYNADFEDEAMSGIEGKGYESFGELATDLASVIDVVWVSGTPSLQVPYLLTIALTSCSCLPAFPFGPLSTFQLLHKLDLAFFSLLKGANYETGETLPGFEGGRAKLSTTEKVRLRGLVERTRVAVVEVAGKGGSATDFGSAVQTEDDLTTDDDDEAMQDVQLEENRGRWEMEVARVYEKTLVELGVSLDTSGIGTFD